MFLKLSFQGRHHLETHSAQKTALVRKKKELNKLKPLITDVYINNYNLFIYLKQFILMVKVKNKIPVSTP